MTEKIYVAMHKKVELPKLDSLYEPLLVGSFNKKENIGLIRDDSGKNISEKNENYCELTGIYWIWKNSKEDIVGLCHYRRFLAKNKLWKVNSNDYLSKNDIINFMHRERAYIETTPRDIIEFKYAENLQI